MSRSPNNKHIERDDRFSSTYQSQQQFRYSPTVDETFGLPPNDSLQPLMNTFNDMQEYTDITNSAYYDNGVSDIASNHFPDVNPQKSLNAISVVSSIPKQFQGIFPYREFNPVQSQCFQSVFHGSRNIVVSAPTSCGKTALMELALVRLFNSQEQNVKAIYIAPTKALCSERSTDWSRKFNPLGIEIGELTGDTEAHMISKIQKCSIIVSTPEKLDSVTRRWKDNKAFIELVRLVLIDEVHILKEPIRGSTLEVLVARLNTIAKNLLKPIRIVAISATIPNIVDIAEWLRDEHGSAELKLFGPEYRPVILEVHVLGFTNNGKTPFQFEHNLTFRLAELINEYSPTSTAGRSILVFCSTRKSAVSTANHLSSEPCFKEHCLSKQSSTVVQKFGYRLTDKDLKSLLPFGILFHHAGLQTNDRCLVEELFLSGRVSILCCTTTLAIGMNLPAQLVIVKGTSQYINGQYTDLGQIDLSQMIGRAGRPQFGDKGIALILTTNEKKDSVLKLATGSEMIESSLHVNLIEHLNAEIVLGTILSLDMAMQWLKSTFLYVRIKKNPAYYILHNCTKEASMLSGIARLEAIFKYDFDILKQNGFITMDNDGAMQTSVASRTMSRYYIKFPTMLRIVGTKTSCSLKEVLELLCSAEEFDDIRFHGDKTALNDLNKNADIRFKLVGRVKEVKDKVFILIQCVLGNIAIDKNTSYSSTETNQIVHQSARILRAMSEVFVDRKDYLTTQNCLTLSQCIHARVWENTRLLMLQFDGVGPVLARQFAQVGVSSFSQLQCMQPRDIEMILNRNAPFGSKMHEQLSHLPKFNMNVLKMDTFRERDIQFAVTISVDNPTTVKTSSKNGAMFCVFLCGWNRQVIDHRRIPMHKVKEGFRFTFNLKPPSKQELNSNPGHNVIDTMRCSVMSEEYVGLDVTSVFKDVLKQSMALESVPEIQPVARVKPIDEDVDFETIDPDLLTIDLSKYDQEVAKPAAKLQSDSVIPCNHCCLNKMTCKHECCKTGITKRRHKQRQKQGIQSLHLNEATVPTLNKDVENIDSSDWRATYSYNSVKDAVKRENDDVVVLQDEVIAKQQRKKPKTMNVLHDIGTTHDEAFDDDDDFDLPFEKQVILAKNASWKETQNLQDLIVIESDEDGNTSAAVSRCDQRENLSSTAVEIVEIVEAQEEKPFLCDELSKLRNIFNDLID